HRGVVVLLRLPPVVELRHEDAQGGSRVAFTDDQVSGEVPGRPPLAQGRGVLTRTAGGVDESQAFGTGQIVLHARQSPILDLDSPGRPGCDEVGYAGQRPEIGELVASCGTVGDDDDGFAGFGRGADEAQSRQHRERGPEYDDPPRPLADAVRLLQPGRWDRIAEVD